MKTREEKTEEVLKIPSDMLIDILAIILKEGLEYELIEVLENRAIAIYAIRTSGKLSREDKALQNIKDLLSCYNDYRHSQEDSFNWKEE